MQDGGDHVRETKWRLYNNIDKNREMKEKLERLKKLPLIF